MFTTPLEDGVEPVELILFGDLAGIFEDELRTLLHIREHEALQAFFERVAFALREELGHRPLPIQNLFPRFTTLIDLVARLGETDGTPVLQFFLMTVCQIAKFILFVSGRSYPSPQKACVLGVCAGSFAAAAISVSRSVSDVVRTGVDASRTAFCTALCSFIRGSTLAAPTEDHKTWSVVVSREKAVQTLLDDFVSCPLLSKPYVSARAPTSVTITGPPHILRDFLSKNQLDSHALAIGSPFHASHLFDEEDVEQILLGLPDADILDNTIHLPVLSCSTGGLIASRSFRELLWGAVNGVLRELVDWENIVTSYSNNLKAQSRHRCTIYPFYSSAASLLSSFLAREAGVEVSIQNISPPQWQKHSMAPGQPRHSKIAIIGYSGRFPDAESNEEFWELLRAGRDVHHTIPEDRFPWKTHYDPTGKKKNTSRVKYGCFIRQPGLFDTKFFNMSPREAENTDPAQRLAIMATYEAMEMAGFVPNRTPSTQQDRVGVFFGITSDDWREVNSGQNVDTFFISGGNRAFVPGRISYFFRFSGPSLSIDTACSSSFAAIQTACGYLWQGECDTAIAGGSNILTNPDNFAGLDRGHFLSTTGNCNAFDDGASGYCRADGVGAVILKRLEDAIADNDPIFGVITGTNTNHCGQTDSITRPHEGDQVSVFRRVLRYHNVNPDEVGYIEMHGTGTQAGDATEMRSVLSVFLPQQKRRAEQPLYLGSVKANIGHAESASGVLSLIKVLLMMKHDKIPPHCGIKTQVNRHYPVDLAERNVRIALQSTPWRRQEATGGTRRVFLNNFSAAGGNTAILLEDAPVLDDSAHQASAVDSRGMHLVAVTAKTPTSLSANTQTLLQFLESNPSTSLPALAYTTTARRLHHRYRVTCIGDSIPSIVTQLRRLSSQPEKDLKPVPAATPKVTFVFTGQGSVYPGLGRQLFESVPSFREDILSYNRIAQKHGFPPFISLIDGSSQNVEEVDPCISQLALVCLQMALSQLWTSWGVCPSLVIGHSLGEYAALFTAGVITASDAIFLAGCRAKLLSQSCTPGTHAMLALKKPATAVQTLLQGSPCEIACINQPMGTVVSGPKESILQLESKVRQEGSESVLLDIPFAFHSAQVDPILEDFQAAARTVQYRTPQVPVLSPLLGRVVREEHLVDDTYLVKACRAAVNFQGAIKAAQTDGLVDRTTVWLEIGSHPACSGMIKGTLGSDALTIASLRKSNNAWKCIVSALDGLYLAGVGVNWNGCHRGFPASHQVIQLPRYNWDTKNYWIMYRNDFCLTKGTASHPLEDQKANPVAHRYISPSVQRVLEETHGLPVSTLLVESDICHPRLLPALTGHIVNGAALGPSSLYGDIALTLAKLLVDGNESSTFSGFDVCDVKVNRPLVLQPSVTSQLFRVSATADWPSKLISVSIYSVDQGGKALADHVTLKVRLVENTSTWFAEWTRMAYLINARISSLRQGVVNGRMHHLKRPMVYKLFTSIVDYCPEYQGLEEVILDSDELEAVAQVSFQVDQDGYNVPPFWIDSLGQIAGFIMNGNEHLQADKQVFINHGWGSMRFGEPLQREKVYTTYNRMQLIEGTLYAGDTYILDGNRIVAVYERVTFQAVPRKVLDNLLPGTWRKGQGIPNVKREDPPANLKSSPQTASTPSAPSNRTAPSNMSPRASNVFNSIINIVVQEVGISLSEVQPDSLFADLGIDSLLSLTVTSRINDELGMNLSPSLFAEYPTIRDLQSFITPTSTDGATTPALVPDSETDEDDHPAELTTTDSVIDVEAIVRQTISEQIGIPATSIPPGTCMAELGVDSLLGLTIADALSESLGQPISCNLLAANDTLDQIEAAVRKSLGLSTILPLSQPLASNIRPSAKVAVTHEMGSCSPAATSVMLQRPKHGQSPRQTLFLFPDGSGSAASYAFLPRLDPSIAVCGLNCPWRTTPEDMVREAPDMSQLVAKYIFEIRKIQPTGPYQLGGWSAGGICAFEAARQLLEAGEAVNKLILLDSPNPIGLENPPARMYDFFETLGLFGSGGADSSVPQWLRAHFDAFIGLLDRYEPCTLPNAPPTVMIYARDGICKDPSTPRPTIRDDDPREMLWLLNNRTDFSAEGWVSLVGQEKIKVHVLDNVNHFSMMDAGPSMELMGEYIRRAMKEAL